MPSTETIAHFIRRCRLRLDEELDPGANLWTDTELVEYANEGAREVHTTLRETSENWFIRTLRSSDPKEEIGGRLYDPSLLKFQANRSELILPPDFHELMTLETLPAADGTRSSVAFHFERLTDNAFRENHLAEARSIASRFFYEIEHRTDSTVLLLSPTPGDGTESTHLFLKYVQAPPELSKLRTFEDTGFEPFMLDAILAYVLWAARGKEEEGGDAERAAFSRWEGKRQHATRAAGPRQRRDAEYVEGFLENEDD